jgi:ribosomal protein L11
MLNKDIKFIKKCYLMSQKAEAVPPLGTILGNIGVNTIKFCDEFNNYTKELPNYFLLKVFIIIFENKTFKFLINKPATSHLMNLLKFDKKIKIIVKNYLHEKIINCIKLRDIIKIAKFKYPNKNLQLIIPIL